MRPIERTTLIYVGLIAVLTACGPGMTVIKSYISTSPRKTIALMPFSIADKQSDVAAIAQNSVRERLLAYGFIVLWSPKVDVTAPAFGPHTSVPTAGQVLDYGRSLKAPVVLAARIERAQEGKPGKDAVYRDQKRWVPDGRGGRVAFTDRVIAKPETPGTPADFLIEMALIQTNDGATLWRDRAVNKMPNWTLAEVARSCSQEKISELAEAYLAHKL